MNSLSIREARENIVIYLNEVPLPLEAKRLVVKEILGQLDVAAEQEIAMQVKQRDEERKEKEEEITDD